MEGRGRKECEYEERVRSNQDDKGGRGGDQGEEKGAAIMCERAAHERAWVRDGVVVVRVVRADGARPCERGGGWVSESVAMTADAP